ncbi:HlyD family secretion protein [Hyphomicrobium sp.]|uniref:HlyD family secretion protein n=1 Tax=Hyphomicrobium sp. TaxID=82 RepID=UPI002D7803C6|nr:HlyD family secretion protein [Hyphomicrobium sp.]HET6388517.1 HlyD family secretion protein [Hyphomicrobium sp.]
MSDDTAGAEKTDSAEVQPPAPLRSAFSYLRTLGILAITSAGVLSWHLSGSDDRWTRPAHSEPAKPAIETTDNAFIAGDVTPLAAKVSGYIKSVPVTDFQTVKKGDVLAEIDKSDYEAALTQAQANVAAAQANIDNIAYRKEAQQSLIRQAEAAIDAAQADVDGSNLEVKRQQDLLNRNTIGTAQRVEQAQSAAKRAAAQLLLSKAQRDQQKTMTPSINLAQQQFDAQLRAAKAAADVARDNLASTRILAPTDGMVGLRQVRPGQFVAAGSPIITVVSLPKVWVIANLKETQMTKVRAGQTARVKIDAFPDLKVTGRVSGWAPETGSPFASQAPDGSSGNFAKVVQRVPVKILLDQNPDLGTLVRPGMSVEVAIETGPGQPKSEPNTVKRSPDPASASAN